jgi:hypothetical protein
MVDITYWKSLPRESKVSLKIKCDNEWEHAVFTYWYTVDDVLIYGQLTFDRDSEYLSNTEGQTFTYECDSNNNCYLFLKGLPKKGGLRGFKGV